MNERQCIVQLGQDGCSTLLYEETKVNVDLYTTVSWSPPRGYSIIEPGQVSIGTQCRYRMRQ